MRILLILLTFAMTTICFAQTLEDRMEDLEDAFEKLDESRLDVNKALLNAGEQLDLAGVHHTRAMNASLISSGFYALGYIVSVSQAKKNPANPDFTVPVMCTVVGFGFSVGAIVQHYKTAQNIKRSGFYLKEL